MAKNLKIGDVIEATEAATNKNFKSFTVDRICIDNIKKFVLIYFKEGSYQYFTFYDSVVLILRYKEEKLYIDPSEAPLFEEEEK